MEVKVMSATPNPAQVCSSAAGCCYGKDKSVAYSERRLQTCLNNGHLSVFEHASATWRVEGISRACSHQLVRHRLASYSQQSQRYCKIDVDGDWYVKPPDLIGKREYLFRQQMEQIARTYKELLESGVNPEDARFILPNACKTDIYVTMNFRELMHFLDERNTQQAQWEIRELAQQMAAALADESTQWAMLLEMYGESGGRYV